MAVAWRSGSAAGTLSLWLLAGEVRCWWLLERINKSQETRQVCQTVSGTVRAQKFSSADGRGTPQPRRAAVFGGTDDSARPPLVARVRGGDATGGTSACASVPAELDAGAAVAKHRSRAYVCAPVYEAYKGSGMVVGDECFAGL